MRWIVSLSTCLSVASVSSRSAHQASKKFSAIILQHAGCKHTYVRQDAGLFQRSSKRREGSQPCRGLLAMNLQAKLAGRGVDSMGGPAAPVTALSRQPTTHCKRPAPEPGRPQQAAAGVHHLPQLREGHILGVLRDGERISNQSQNQKNEGPSSEWPHACTFQEQRMPAPGVASSSTKFQHTHTTLLPLPAKHSAASHHDLLGVGRQRDVRPHKQDVIHFMLPPLGCRAPRACSGI